MNKKKKIVKYYCKRCGTIETFTENEDGIQIDDIINVICPRCVCKRGYHRYKMLRIKTSQEAQKQLKNQRK